jgi:hypothetical protein
LENRRARSVHSRDRGGRPARGRPSRSHDLRHTRMDALELGKCRKSCSARAWLGLDTGALGPRICDRSGRSDPGLGTRLAVHRPACLPDLVGQRPLSARRGETRCDTYRNRQARRFEAEDGRLETSARHLMRKRIRPLNCTRRHFVSSIPRNASASTWSPTTGSGAASARRCRGVSKAWWGSHDPAAPDAAALRGARESRGFPDGLTHGGRRERTRQFRQRLTFELAGTFACDPELAPGRRQRVLFAIEAEAKFDQAAVRAQAASATLYRRRPAAQMIAPRRWRARGYAAAVSFSLLNGSSMLFAAPQRGDKATKTDATVGFPRPSRRTSGSVLGQSAAMRRSRSQYN